MKTAQSFARVALAACYLGVFCVFVFLLGAPLFPQSRSLATGILELQRQFSEFPIAIQLAIVCGFLSGCGYVIYSWYRTALRLKQLRRFSTLLYSALSSLALGLAVILGGGVLVVQFPQLIPLGVFLYALGESVIYGSAIMFSHFSFDFVFGPRRS